VLGASRAVTWLSVIQEAATGTMSGGN
jgi:hypothetical protein